MFHMERAKMTKADREKHGCFMRFFRDGLPSEPVSVNDYLRAGRQVRFASSWNQATTAQEMVELHEEAMAAILHENGRLQFGYAIDQKRDYTDDSCFRVGQIRNLLTEFMKLGIMQEMEGLTTAYSYLCSWAVHFSNHKEDDNLLSVNLLVKGGAKVWICIKPSCKEKLERLIKNILVHAGSKEGSCNDPSAHRSFFFPLSFLHRNEIMYTIVIQKEGEIMVTLPDCHHSGWNWGESVNVAANVATSWWLTHAMNASRVSDRSSCILCCPVSLIITPCICTLVLVQQEK
jgi:hypothetical protein